MLNLYNLLAQYIFIQEFKMGGVQRLIIFLLIHLDLKIL